MPDYEVSVNNPEFRANLSFVYLEEKDFCIKAGSYLFSLTLKFTQEPDPKLLGSLTSVFKSLTDQLHHMTLVPQNDSHLEVTTTGQNLHISAPSGEKMTLPKEFVKLVEYQSHPNFSIVKHLTDKLLNSLEVKGLNYLKVGVTNHAKTFEATTKTVFK
mgnify:CR=1 FL=1